ncbi:hypothetical protein E1H13_22155 [Nodosilinea sp. P-1105]|nr:hypothetical protein [Nodosilinea sp. P-1105]
MGRALAILQTYGATDRKFCQRYKPKPKLERKTYWGTRLLEKIKKKGKPQKTSSGQMNLWYDWTILAEIYEVSRKFIEANCYIPQAAIIPSKLQFSAR